MIRFTITLSPGQIGKVGKGCRKIGQWEGCLTQKFAHFHAFGYPVGKNNTCIIKASIRRERQRYGIVLIGFVPHASKRYGNDGFSVDAQLPYSLEYKKHF